MDHDGHEVNEHVSNNGTRGDTLGEWLAKNKLLDYQETLEQEGYGLLETLTLLSVPEIDELSQGLWL